VSRLLKKVREKANGKRRSTPSYPEMFGACVLAVVFYSVFFKYIKIIFLTLVYQNDLKTLKNNLKK
jgi:hypothetical protein